MPLTGRIPAIIIVVAILFGAGVGLMLMHGPNPEPPLTNLSGVPVHIAGTSSKTWVNPGSFERYCLPEGEDQSQFLTSFWGMVANQTGVDDSSAVLLNFQLTGYPGKIPQILWFSFSSKKDWWSGSRRIIYFGDDEGTCGCFSITPSEERSDISGERVPSPGELFAELEQVSFSDMGVGGEELFITTGLNYGVLPADPDEKLFLLVNESVVPLHGIPYHPETSTVYVWGIQIMECTGEPKTCSSRPGVVLYSDQRLLKGSEYRNTG